MMDEQGVPFKSIRRESFVEAYGIPEDESSPRNTESRHSITIEDIINMQRDEGGDFDLDDDIDDTKNNCSYEQTSKHRHHNREDSQSSWGSTSPPNFAGGNIRRKGNRDRRTRRAKSRRTIGPFSSNNTTNNGGHFSEHVRRSSTGSLEQSFGDISLASFTSESSFTSGNGTVEQKGLEIANLLFVTDAEMATIMADENEDERLEGGEDEQQQEEELQKSTVSNHMGASLPPSAILGIGAFSTVRLAWRKVPPSTISTRQQQRRSIVRVLSQDSTSSLPHKGQLVAVKMIQKSILKQMKTMHKDADNRLTVRTAFDDIEKEIATMKRLRHPNCVQLFDVIDSIESDKLYMVLEYVSLGEILSNVEGTDRYERKRYRKKVNGLTPEGYFDEKNAALYFVDILHGLAYLHRHSICHRDLKPENILLGINGIAKISDFGVAHMFDDERSSWTIMHNEACGGDDNNPINEFLSDDEDDEGCHDDGERKIDEVESPTHLSKLESEEAINMSSRHSSGMLKKTEGTMYFFAPEMCSLEKQAFSGYAADLWAAGVCLHIFVTGKLPFFALNPSDLFGMIVQNEVQYDNFNLSNELKSLLRKLLTKDPSVRAGVGDCLKHNYCKDARAQRIQELGTEFQQSKGEIVLTDTDINLALSVTMISNAFVPRQQPRRSISEQRVPDTKRTHSKLYRTIEVGKAPSLTEIGAKRQTKRPSMLKELFKVGYFRRKKKKELVDT